MANKKGTEQMAEQEAVYFEAEDVEGYRLWVRRHPGAYVYTVNHGRIHDVDCPHMEVYADDKGKGTPKIAATSLPALRREVKRRYGEESTLDWCKHCQM